MEEYRIDDLQIANLFLKQDPNLFCFGTDAVLLANFASKFIKPESAVIDLGCGNGIIPVLLTAKCKSANINGLEINPQCVKLARENVVLNNLQNRIKIFSGDIKSPPEEIKPSTFDVVISNPPYIQHKDGAKNNNEHIACAKHEVFCTLKDVINCADKLLKCGGVFAMIHRTQRLSEVICLMHEYKIEPKEIIMIHPNKNKKSNLFLIKGLKGGGVWCDVLPPVYIYDENGNYTSQVKDIYEIDK
ncbi:MAG: tRNA1(Val) (adenine(37)-N6)-methyltransferase [Eubacteriaceae bacterium]|nr:tRNA1(Val) (adenine(37)-N6)-methyltransferase [Eubacteriaceae bacterium]